MASMKTTLNLKRIHLLIEETQDILDERIRLYELDEPLDSSTDLTDNLNSIIRLFNHLDSELIYNLKDYLKYKELLEAALANYNVLLETIELQDDKVEIGSLEKYKIETLKCLEQEKEQQQQSKRNQNHQSDVTSENGQGKLPLKAKKSVRFKESLIEPPSSSSIAGQQQKQQQQLQDESDKVAKQNLFQQSVPTDEMDQIQDQNSMTDDLSNRQIFINNEQEFIRQDEMLDTLSNSVRTQRQMGLSINEEVDDHLIVLNDLERMIDGTTNKLDRGRKNIHKVNEKLRKNGNWLLILVLFVILVFLIVVL